MIRKPRNVLVLHGGALGDFVLMAHAVAAIRAANPALHVEILARCPLRPWAIRHGAADAGRNWEQNGLHLLYAEEFDFDHPRWGPWQGYDLVVSFLGAANDTLLRNVGRITGAKIVTLNPRPSPESGRTHVVDQWKHGLRNAGITVGEMALWSPKSDPQETAERRGRLRALLAITTDRIIIFHPGSGGRRKCRPLERWLAAAKQWRSYGIGVVWMIGPDERERDGEALIRSLQSIAPVLYEESVEEAAAWLTAADGFVGHDAGMTHLAAACGLPTAALFTSTDPHVWRPLGPHVAVLE